MSKPIINVTPLIDVLLVLLIIFMIVTPLRPSSFETKVPQPPMDDALVTPHPDTLVVTILNDSSLALNREVLNASVDDAENLTAALAKIFAGRELNMSTERTVFVKAPKDYNYGDVVKVIDAVKVAGAHPISLQIDHLK